MTKLTEILRQYGRGEKTIDEINAELRKEGFDLQLNESKHTITPEEAVMGFGWLDSGTGTLDKVLAVGDQLVNCDMGDTFALFIRGDEVYEVQGKKLIKR